MLLIADDSPLAVRWVDCSRRQRASARSSPAPLRIIHSPPPAGHCGYHIESDNAPSAVLALIGPFILALKVTPFANRAMDHEAHHLFPTKNFALYFGWWDDWWGSDHPAGRGRGTWLLHLVITGGFYVPFVFYTYWAAYQAPLTFWGLVLVHLATPLPRLCYALLGGRAARWVTRLPVWDAVRRDFQVTYAAPGEPGAFEPSNRKSYLFCYQPYGVQARGAWYTFAGKGRGSPVAAVRGVKLAVSREIWVLPVAQQVFSLFDCCDSSYRTLKELLGDKVREHTHACSCISWSTGRAG